tara:strand:- start:71 stop:451 length:381 start_codon:yes stop_codon:yes gene_type:complete
MGSLNEDDVRSIVEQVIEEKGLGGGQADDEGGDEGGDEESPGEKKSEKEEEKEAKRRDRKRENAKTQRLCFYLCANWSLQLITAITVVIAIIWSAIQVMRIWGILGISNAPPGIAYEVIDDDSIVI